MTSAEPVRSIYLRREALVNGVRLHYIEAGRGPLVLLLHGFPEFWYSWRHQIPALAAAGFHVLAPDLRGYNQSDKPAGAENYRLDVLVEDVFGLIRHAGERSAAVVGHDWGGVIAWHLPERAPQVVTKLVILNAPHPRALGRELRSAAQWLRSWYTLFFQLPWLPELALRFRNYAVLERCFRRDPVHADAFTGEDIALYKQALSRPGALTAAINYYRAAFRGLRTTPAISPIRVSTLLIWGERDRYLGVGFTEHLDPWVPGIRVERLADASHWVQNDVPERVNRLLIDFLQKE
ncbi:MAG TPA: alpha/beta fold hydrolase [Gemmataceae bacterium]|jgi:pimeloyl-ACP methyl ester carboxylesterase|nr:alpha/beta fold hydrolase [Gemmataceae bacterium]